MIESFKINNNKIVRLNIGNNNKKLVKKLKKLKKLFKL